MLEGIGDFGKATIGLATAAAVGAGIGYLIAGGRRGIGMGLASQIALYGAMQLVADKHAASARFLYVGSALAGSGLLGFLYFKNQAQTQQPLLGLGFNRALSTPQPSAAQEVRAATSAPKPMGNVMGIS